jgi:hypothetical protein
VGSGTESAQSRDLSDDQTVQTKSECGILNCALTGSNTRVFALESRSRDVVEVQTIMEHALHDI